MKTALPYAELALNRRLRWSGLIDGWRLIALGVACAVALPVLVVLASLLAPSRRDLGAPRQHRAARATCGTRSRSALGVGCGVLVIGVGTAWLVSMCSFPGRRLFEWALLLPLAVPTYIIGYTYTDLLEYAGPVQTLLREATGWTHADYWFPPIRSLGGAIVVMSLVLYPYVYLLARAAFLEQCTCMLDVSRTLGRGAWGSFFEVAVPLARPAIAGGVALALMETLADFGTVQYFGVDTFTTGIYRTWFALGEPAGGRAARGRADAGRAAGAHARARQQGARQVSAHRAVAPALHAIDLRGAARPARELPPARCRWRSASPCRCWSCST